MKLEEIYGIKNGGDRKSDGHNVPLKSQEELADDLGMTEEHLRRYKSLQKLTPELQELVETGELNFTTAVKVWTKLPQEELFDNFLKIC